MRDREAARDYLLVVRHPPAVPAPPSDSSEQHARDLELVRAARGDDPGAAQELAERLACVPAMVRGRNRRLGAPLREEELAEVIQDVLLTVWRRLDSFGGRSRVETWVYGFVVHLVHRRVERERSRPRRLDPEAGGLELEVHDDPPEPEDEYRVVHDKLAAIGPPGADIIRLKHFDQLTFEQIGDELDMPVNTVKTRYYRSVERLRALLTPYWRQVSE